ncbi:GntR family transcriptional regulator [Actinomycetospora rhizophila]|uniref:GntR family transcriptional regulator n=1 Tax=Actinomycetospora rhizophila TaxID=1416876 RepID=A0ABV9ZJC0_9PSEU
MARVVEQSRPLYEQVAEHIRARVASGELRPGDKVPSQRELKEEFGIQTATANQAVALLKSWGVVETRVGSYTRVAEHPTGVPANGPRDHTARMLAGAPLYTEGETSRILEAASISTANVGTAVLQAAGLPTPDPEIPTETTQIIKRSRLMYREGRLTGSCTTWIPQFLVAQQPGGAEVIEQLTTPERIPGGTGRLLADLYGVEHTHDAYRVGLRQVPTALARELGVEPGSPLLWILATRFGGEYVLEVDEWFRFDDAVFG